MRISLLAPRRFPADRSSFDSAGLSSGTTGSRAQMRRREFITLLTGLAAWPFAARAQHAGKLPTIGILGTATPSIQSQWFIGFVQRLRELGWIEDRTVAIELRWAEGRSERYTEIAADFVRRKVDVIVTSGAAVLAAKQATSVIPIVFAAGKRPGRRRPRRELVAAGGQRHRPVAPGPRSCRQTSPTLARACPGSAPFGDFDQPRLSGRSAGNGRG
jgi:hypothetical protein